MAASGFSEEAGEVTQGGSAAEGDHAGGEFFVVIRWSCKVINSASACPTFLPEALLVACSKQNYKIHVSAAQFNCCCWGKKRNLTDVLPFRRRLSTRVHGLFETTVLDCCSVDYTVP